MLSRVAESLYWIGRYVERAEDTSRLLDVHVHTLLEDPWVDEAGASRDVLAVMGIEVPSGLLDARRTTEWLAFRPGDTSSIVGALAAARENARGVREALSSELWEALNTTFHALPAQEALARRHGPHGFFRYVRGRAAVVAGLLDGTMPRDDGWRFLVLGRSLERVDMTARLLWSRGQPGNHDTRRYGPGDPRSFPSAPSAGIEPTASPVLDCHALRRRLSAIARQRIQGRHL